MFTNPGRQIQRLAILLFCLFMVLFIAGGYFVFTRFNEDNSLRYVIFAAIVCVGFIFAWITTLLMYAVGTLIENAELIKWNTELQLQRLDLIESHLRAISLVSLAPKVNDAHTSSPEK